jgi:sarcosine oxidase/L-pipecolate oxidase
MKIAIHDKGYKHPTPSRSTTTPTSFPSFASAQEGNTDKDVSLMSSEATPYVPADKLSTMLKELTNIYPHLVNIPLVYTRMCFYSESHNEDWIIDRVPGLKGLVVVSGDSGHGFKFLPIIGRLVCARLGLPSVPPLTEHQDKVFSFKHHHQHLKTQQSLNQKHHRGRL